MTDSSMPAAIGPYQPISLLGEGAMARVYLAWQSAPLDRQVAVKILKRGMDSDSVTRRFEAERQALARLDHPCIANIFDAGVSDDGLPFFVMAPVDGENILSFADHRKLSVKQRLDLFLHVCSAVQHAHIKGLIHRDLKPSNILATLKDGEPRPVIIDFGIAKATDVDAADAAGLTRVGQAPGTPKYMSPEQFIGGDIDTRADIYALGVVLYELLSGVPPIDFSSVTPHAFPFLVTEKQPVRPSKATVADAGRQGELAAARSTDPAKLSASLRGDLDWIVMKAIAKRADDRYDSVGEFADDLRRLLDKRPVSARPPTAAYVARRFLRRNFAAVTASALAVVALVAGTVAATVGMIQARDAERTARQEALAAESVTEFLVGLFEISDPSESRGNEVTAREVLDAAVEDIDQELVSQPAIQARLIHTMAEVYKNLGLYRDAAGLAESALALRRNHADAPADVAASLDLLGELRSELGDQPTALALIEEALRLREEDGRGPTPEWVDSLQLLATVHYMQSNLQGAEQHFLAAREMALALSPPNPVLVADVNGNLGVVYSVLRIDDLAERYKREAVEMFERVHGRIHPKTATAKNNLALTLNQMGRYRESAAAYRDALDIYRALYGTAHPLIANTMNNLALVELQLGNNASAEALLTDSLSVYEQLLGSPHSQIATVMINIGRARVQQGNYSAAEAIQREGLAMQEALLPAGHHRIAIASDSLAVTLNKKGSFAEAETLARRAFDSRLERYGADDVRSARSAVVLGHALAGQQRYAEAEALMLPNYERVVESLGSESIAALESLQSIVWMYDRQGKAALAEEYRARRFVTAD